MIRLVFLFLGVLASVHAQEGERVDRLWRTYLSETVRRGLPLLNSSLPSATPYWPQVNRARRDAESLEPGADTVLLGSWIDLWEGVSPAQELRDGWPSPKLARLTQRQWGEALFRSWAAEADPKEWTEAWLAWSNKVYSPASLVTGIQGLERTDASAVLPLLGQALRLYPEDRRFLPLVARHPEAVRDAAALLSRDRVNRGGWTNSTLRALLDRSPSSKALLVKAGYSASSLDASLTGDYASWLASNQPAPEGVLLWDADQDGSPESSLLFDGGLRTWTRHTADGLWTLSFEQGRPVTLTETRGGAVWSLKWEDYPWAATLEYQWGGQTLVYRFRPLEQAVPLWPAERFQAAPERLPSVLAGMALPVDAHALAAASASVETWRGGLRVRLVALSQGEVWYEAEDTNDDGFDDRWSYFRSGLLASVYSDLEGRGQANLRELYRRGELSQVQAKGAARTEFVLFPHEGVQLWDPHGHGRPLERLFVWSGEDKLNALVFSGATLPWETMPVWEPRP